MKILLRCTAFLFVSIILFSCNNANSDASAEEQDVPEIGIPESFDYGKVENNVYRNKYFKCSMQLPKDWIVQDEETVKQLTKTASDRVAGDDEDLKRAVEVGQINSANLLAVSKLDLATALEPNPNFMVLVENVSSAPNMTEGKDYLEQAKTLMRRTQMNYSYISENLKSEVINGETFYSMDVTLNMGTSEVKQCYLATIRKKFAFVVVITYFTEEEKAFIDKYIHTLKFEKEDA